MRKRLVLAVLSNAAAAAGASAATLPMYYDGFNYSAEGNPPLGATLSNLALAPTPGEWVYQGNNTVEPRIFADSLNYPGLPPSVGNKVKLDNTAPTGADASRLNIGIVDKNDVPTLYYSFITSVPSSTSTNQPFFAGFDNLTTNVAYTSFGGLFVRQQSGDTTNVNLGIGTSGSTNRAWTSVLPHDTPLFIVASFTFGGLSNLDVYLDPAAVPLTEPSTHSATSTNVDASAVTTVSNFYLRGNSGEPQGILIDELRIGTTWADVAAKGYYWDIDGSTPGAGGTAPSGNWDGTTANFNSDPAGGAAGTTLAVPTRGDTVLFSAGNGATGSYTINVTGTRSAAEVNIKNGNVTFTNGTLAVNRFSIAAGAGALVSSAVTGGEANGAVIKTGDGTATFAGPNTWTGATAVNAGRLVLGTSLTTSPTVSVSGSGTLELSPDGSHNKVIRTGPISITGTGRIDLQDNKLITTTAVGTFGTTNTYSGVTGLIQTGRGTGSWDGTVGIVTSQSDAVVTGRTSIGVATAAQAKGITASDTAMWAGQRVTGSDTLVMYTYGGDANLDGKINIDDYGHIDTSVGLINDGWFNGDFNYDGKINIDDYGIIDVNVGVQTLGDFPTGPAATVGGVAAVPEPTAGVLLALAGAALFPRRPRRAR